MKATHHIEFWFIASVAFLLAFFGLNSVAYGASSYGYAPIPFVDVPPYAYSDTNDAFGTVSGGLYGLGNLFTIGTSTDSSVEGGNVMFWLTKEGTPTDQLYANVWNGNRDTLLTSSSLVSASDISGTNAQIVFNLRNSVTFSTSSSYFVEVLRTGSLDNANYYRVRNFEENNAENSLGYEGLYRSCSIDATPSIPGECSPTNVDTYAMLISAGEWTIPSYIYAENLGCPEYGSLFSSTTMEALQCQFEQTAINIVEFLFVPGDSSLSTFSEALDDLKGTFPASVFYTYTGAIEAGIENASSSVEDYTVTIHIPPFDEWTLLSSSTLLQTFGATTTATIFTVESAIIWVGTLITMVAILFL